MPLLDDIGKKLSQTGQDAAKKAKDFADITKLNLQIDAENKEINGYNTQIGAKYFELFSENPDENLAELCSKVKDAVKKIADYQDHIKKIKEPETNIEVEGKELCPKCGAEIISGAAFCSSCGYKIAQTINDSIPAIKVCTNCGKELQENSAYCTGCGQKVN